MVKMGKLVKKLLFFCIDVIILGKTPGFEKNKQSEDVAFSATWQTGKVDNDSRHLKMENGDFESYLELYFTASVCGITVFLCLLLLYVMGKTYRRSLMSFLLPSLLTLLRKVLIVKLTKRSTCSTIELWSHLSIDV